MRFGKRATASALSVCFLGAAMAANAEKWVRVVDNPGGENSFADVDEDSIRRDADGLVYYMMSDDWNTEMEAVDCRKRVKYSVDYWKKKKKDWRRYPLKITGFGVEIADFVCARAPKTTPPAVK